MFKKICLLLALTLLLGITFAGCGGGSTDDNQGVEAEETSWDDIQAKGKFVMGLDDSFPPMGFRSAGGDIVGFDVDFAKAVAEYLGVEVEFVPIDWGSKELELRQKNIDVVWNGLTMSQARIDSGEWGFSQPYLENRQVILSIAGSGIDTIADLEGKKVGVQFDSSAQAAVEEEPDILATFAGGEIIKLETYTTAILELKNGSLDAVVGDEILIRYVTGNDDSARYFIATEDFGDELYAIGFRPGDLSFIEAVNGALNALIGNGTAASVSTEWFGSDIVYVP